MTFPVRTTQTLQTCHTLSVPYPILSLLTSNGATIFLYVPTYLLSCARHSSAQAHGVVFGSRGHSQLPFSGWALRRRELVGPEASTKRVEDHSGVPGFRPIPRPLQSSPYQHPTLLLPTSQNACNGEATHAAIALSAEHAEVRWCISLRSYGWYAGSQAGSTAA